MKHLSGELWLRGLGNHMASAEHHSHRDRRSDLRNFLIAFFLTACALLLIIGAINLWSMFQ